MDESEKGDYVAKNQELLRAMLKHIIDLQNKEKAYLEALREKVAGVCDES